MEMTSHPYRKLSASLGISFILMYTVMFFNVDDPSHIYLSLNRAYMAILMVSPMCVVMLILMKGMYPDKKRNKMILVSSIIIFLAAVYCLRTQAFISDIQYMKGMIPHHSSAVMTSKHASIKDKRVKALADSIVHSQLREIELMKELVAIEESK